MRRRKKDPKRIPPNIYRIIDRMGSLATSKCMQNGIELEKFAEEMNKAVITYPMFTISQQFTEAYKNCGISPKGNNNV